MDDGDYYKNLLDAQKQFFEAITQVRDAMAQENREMRAELVNAFNRAHDENKERMDAIATNLREHVTEDRAHSDKDDRRFQLLNRAMWVAVGGVAMLTTLMQLYLNFFK